MSSKLNFYGKTAGGAKGNEKIKYAIIAIGAFAITLFVISGINSKGPTQDGFGENPFPELTQNGTLVAFVEFSDFQCPYCARAQGTVSLLKAEYAGRVNFVFKQFPIHGNLAEKAAQATECARDQGLFEPYHLKVFESYSTLSIQKLKDLFFELEGADGAAFSSCLDSSEKAGIVKADYDRGIELGIRATPTFFVNGRKIEGALGIADFKRAIDSELAKG